MQLVKSSLVNFCYISGNSIIAKFYFVKGGEKIEIDKPIISDLDVEKIDKLGKPWIVSEKRIIKETGRFSSSELFSELKKL